MYYLDRDYQTITIILYKIHCITVLYYAVNHRLFSHTDSLYEKYAELNHISFLNSYYYDQMI